MTNVATFISQNLTGWHALTLYFLLSTTISSRLTVVSGFFALAINQFSEKKAEYECGFEPFDSATRLPFEVHFYLIGILFLVFDVEVLVSLPRVVAQHFIDWFGFFAREFFICLLTVGFIFEWQRGALVWPSRAKEEPFENSIPFVEIVVIFFCAFIIDLLVDRFAIITAWETFWRFLIYIYHHENFVFRLPLVAWLYDNVLYFDSWLKCERFRLSRIVLNRRFEAQELCKQLVDGEIGWFDYRTSVFLRLPLNVLIAAFPTIYETRSNRENQIYFRRICITLFLLYNKF